MNDRYLFRAKRIDNGEWVEGYLVKRYGLFFIYSVINSDTCRQSNYEVYPSTICQCTGLKDKNGKLIWENDIIKFEGMIFSVEWNNACAHFAARKVRERTRCNPVMNSGTMKITEIVGNIFDNPELLGGGCDT